MSLYVHQSFQLSISVILSSEFLRNSAGDTTLTTLFVSAIFSGHNIFDGNNGGAIQASLAIVLCLCNVTFCIECEPGLIHNSIIRKGAKKTNMHKLNVSIFQFCN